MQEKCKKNARKIQEKYKKNARKMQEKNTKSFLKSANKNIFAKYPTSDVLTDPELRFDVG